jgi:hypothetical protein
VWRAVRAVGEGLAQGGSAGRSGDWRGTEGCELGARDRPFVERGGSSGSWSGVGNDCRGMACAAGHARAVIALATMLVNPERPHAEEEEEPESGAQPPSGGAQMSQSCTHDSRGD